MVKCKEEKCEWNKWDKDKKQCKWRIDDSCLYNPPQKLGETI